MSFIHRPRHMRWVAAGAAVICATVLSFGYHYRQTDHPRTPALESRRSNAAPSVGLVEKRDGNLPSAATATGPSKISPASATKSMAALLNDSKDLRAFAMNAINRPEAGGVTYAAYAANLCLVARTAVLVTIMDWTAEDLPRADLEDPHLFAIRNASYKRIKAACQSFSDYESGGERDIQLIAQAKAQGDALEKVALQVKTAIASNDISRRKSALAAVLNNGDPLLVSNQLERLLLEKTPDGLAYWIDGKQVPVMNSAVLQTALVVLPCRLGLVCDERSPEVLAPCLNSGKCYASRVELAMANLPDDAQRAKLTSTLASLESAVRARRIDRFLP
jgi:hypothetical protein